MALEGGLCCNLPVIVRLWALMFLAVQEANPGVAPASSRYNLVLVESLVEVGPLFGAGLVQVQLQF